MALAQFQKGQTVWVKCVGAWAEIEKVKPVWAKGFSEPIRVTYEVGLGREFQANELFVPTEDASSANMGLWRLMRCATSGSSPRTAPITPSPAPIPW